VVDPGTVGSVTDVATLVVVVAMLRYEVRPMLRDTAAGVVALASTEPRVDDDALQSDLDVVERDVDAYRDREVVACGGEVPDD
jgi:hypothetical protein